MDKTVQLALVWQAFALLLIWVPFALTAFVVEHWQHPLARRWRAHYLHPLRWRREHGALAWQP